MDKLLQIWEIAGQKDLPRRHRSKTKPWSIEAIGVDKSSNLDLWKLLTSFVQIEAADNRFIKNTLAAVGEQKIEEMEIACLLLVNRLFTQICRMQIYSMKDLLLSQEQVNNFDRAMDIKEIMDAENKEIEGK